MLERCTISLFAIFLFTIVSFRLDANQILVIGDSLSAGYGIEVSSGWVELLRRRLTQAGFNYRVINDSISGDTTSNGLARMRRSLKLHTPELVVIELGGNDGLRGIAPQEIEKNLQAMINLAEKNNAHVLLLGVELPPNYGPAYTQAFQNIYKHLGVKNPDILVIQSFLKNVGLNQDLMQSDGIHPNAKAQVKLLNTVWPILKTQLKKP